MKKNTLTFEKFKTKYFKKEVEIRYFDKETKICYSENELIKIYKRQKSNL